MQALAAPQLHAALYAEHKYMGDVAFIRFMGNESRYTSQMSPQAKIFFDFIRLSSAHVKLNSPEWPSPFRESPPQQGMFHRYIDWKVFYERNADVLLPYCFDAKSKVGLTYGDLCGLGGDHTVSPWQTAQEWKELRLILRMEHEGMIGQAPIHEGLLQKAITPEQQERCMRVICHVLEDIINKGIRARTEGSAV